MERVDESLATLRTSFHGRHRYKVSVLAGRAGVFSSLVSAIASAQSGTTRPRAVCKKVARKQTTNACSRHAHR